MPGLDTIIIKPNPNVQEAFLTAGHEIGHSLYYEYLTKEERSRWQDLYENTSVFITNYASTEASEDFAESFASTVHCYYDPGDLEENSMDKARVVETALTRAQYGLRTK